MSLTSELIRGMKSSIGNMIGGMFGKATGGSFGMAPAYDPYVRKQQAADLASLRLQKQWTGEDLSTILADIQRNYPLKLRDLKNEAAASGAYESAGRFSNQADLAYQLQQSLAEAQRNYQRSLQELAMREQALG